MRAEPEERQVARLAGQVAVGVVEAADLLLCVAAGRGQQADARVAAAGDLEHVLVECGVAAAAREAAAAHREDAPPVGGVTGTHRAHAATTRRCGAACSPSWVVGIARFSTRPPRLRIR